MRSRARRNRGMTLVELMIVVIIIGILAAIAVVGYSKYRKNARVSEATAILAEFAAKEQLYFLEAGQYMEAHYGASLFPSQNENATEFQHLRLKWQAAGFLAQAGNTGPVEAAFLHVLGQCRLSQGLGSRRELRHLAVHRRTNPMVSHTEHSLVLRSRGLQSYGQGRLAQQRCGHSADDNA
jgi:prepilin-type N-terminal cleavage/methylation domain-containing protein